jgi:predicted kinase
VPAVTVGFKTPLAVCLTRNAHRPADEQVPEQAIRNVHATPEPPHPDEGIKAVIEVEDSPEVPG